MSKRLIETYKAKLATAKERFEQLSSDDSATAEDIATVDAQIENFGQHIERLEKQEQAKAETVVDEKSLEAADRHAVDTFGRKARDEALTERTKAVAAIFSGEPDLDAHVFTHNMRQMTSFKNFAKLGLDEKDIAQQFGVIEQALIADPNFVTITSQQVETIPDLWDASLYKPLESTDGIWTRENARVLTQPKAGPMHYPKITAYDNRTESQNSIRVGEGANSNDVDDTEDETVITVKRYAATVPLTDAVMSSSLVDRVAEAGSSGTRRLRKTVESDVGSASEAGTAGANTPAALRNKPEGMQYFMGANAGAQNTLRNSRGHTIATAGTVAPDEWLEPLANIDFERITRGEIMWHLNYALWVDQYINEFEANGPGFVFGVNADIRNMNIRGIPATHNFTWASTPSGANTVFAFVGSMYDYYLIADSGSIEIKQDPYSKQRAGVVEINMSVYVGGGIQDYNAGAWLIGK